MIERSENYGSPGNREVTLEPDVEYVCQRCTACCKWPGDVRIEEDEILPIANFLGLTESDFLDQFTRLRTNRQGLSLIEKENHECIMLDGNACRIHPVKPEQCSGFPNKWNFPGWRQVCEAIPVPILLTGNHEKIRTEESPPSGRKIWPVKNLEASERRKATS
jgi:uncharacterized protein